MTIFFPFLQAEQFDVPITYEWLHTQSPTMSQADYLPHLRRLFHTMEVRGFLECGYSFSTRYFLENSERVFSIEFLAPSVKTDYFPLCLQLALPCKHWVPLQYNVGYSDIGFNRACDYQKNTHKDYALVSSKYLERLAQYFQKCLMDAKNEGTPIDVAFVDSNAPLRGDMVNLLLANNVPVVVAHDTGCESDLFAQTNPWGWAKVQTPANYERVDICQNNGTTFWIRKDQAFTLSSIKIYKDSLNAVDAQGKISWVAATEIADYLARF